MEFWLFWLTSKIWSFLHNHIKTTQDILHKETPAHFLFTMVSAFFIWSIIISNLTIITQMKTTQEKDSKIESLKIELHTEKAKKIKHKNKTTDCHPEIDWASLAQCFPIAGADSDFETIA